MNNLSQQNKQTQPQIINQLEQEVRETLSSKQEMLKKVRLEVVGLQARLKQAEKELKLPKSLPVKSEPINPWLLGTILIAGIGLFLLLNRRKE